MTECQSCAELRAHIAELNERCEALRQARLKALNNAERLRYRLREAGLYEERTPT